MAQEVEAAAVAAAGRVQRHFAARDFSRPGYWTGSSDADIQNGHSGAALAGGSNDDRGSDEGPTSPHGARRLHTKTNGGQASRDQGQAGLRSPDLQASPAAARKASQAAASSGYVSPLSSDRSRRRAVRSEHTSRTSTVSTSAAPAAVGAAAARQGAPEGTAAGNLRGGSSRRGAAEVRGVAGGARPAPVPGQNLALAQAALRAAGVRGGVALGLGSRSTRARTPPSGELAAAAGAPEDPFWGAPASAGEAAAAPAGSAAAPADAAAAPLAAGQARVQRDEAADEDAAARLTSAQAHAVESAATRSSSGAQVSGAAAAAGPAAAGSGAGHSQAGV